MHNREAQKDPKAQGLLKQLATTGFDTTHMMMDVLPIVSKLCLVFQKEDLDVTMAKVFCTMAHSNLKWPIIEFCSDVCFVVWA